MAESGMEHLELLRMIADGDLSTPFPACGRHLSTLYIRGWVRGGNADERPVVVTVMGHQALRAGAN